MGRNGNSRVYVQALSCLEGPVAECYTVGLLGMYPPGSEEHEWLKIETIKWNRLARALFEVHCFLKSQKKRDPEECDDKLYELWNAWQAAFPGMKFNKFHGLFCGTRNFIHKYHM